jgi:hypothetical protein
MFYISIINHKELRYLLPIALPIFLLSARGFNHFLNHTNKTVKYLCLATLTFFFVLTIMPCFSVFHGQFANTYETEEMRVSAYIKEHYPSDSIIYTNDNFPVFAYYTGMITRNGNDVSAINREKKETILFIVYPLPNSSMTRWVRDQSSLNNIKNFETIQLYEYP